MPGGKGKSSGGKSSGGKTSVEGPKKQQSHSARAGLQVRSSFILLTMNPPPDIRIRASRPRISLPAKPDDELEFDALPVR